MNDQPGSSAHNVVTDNGLRTSTLVGPLDADCCNEDLAIDPTTGNVWWVDFIEGPLFGYNPVTGAVVNSYPQTDVLGTLRIRSLGSCPAARRCGRCPLSVLGPPECGKVHDRSRPFSTSIHCPFSYVRTCPRDGRTSGRPLDQSDADLSIHSSEHRLDRMWTSGRPRDRNERCLDRVRIGLWAERDGYSDMWSGREWAGILRSGHCLDRTSDRNGRASGHAVTVWTRGRTGTDGNLPIRRFLG